MDLREKVLEAKDLPAPEKVECPEWDCTLYVRTITGTERDAFEQSMIERKGKSRKVNLANVRARFAVLCCCDEEGNRVFEDADAAALGRKAAKPLDRLYAKAQELNGFSDEDAEELAKNSDEGQSDNSTSG